jgi:outer membrane receptor protein involved in Fe transport
MGAAPRASRADEAAPGWLRGRVVDEPSGKILPFANVVFSRLGPDSTQVVAAGGVLGKRDGSFLSRLGPGRYRLEFKYLSYASRVVEPIVVRAGETTEVVGRLTPKPIQTRKVLVQAKALGDRTATLLSNQKKADHISDAISSEQMSRSTDSNAAEALGRVTGLSVVDGKYVFVRGLGERYSSTSVNGATVGTPEPNKRVVPLDLFPTGVLDNIVVQKTYTPDMEAEFGGGVIQINTRDFHDKRLLSQSLSVGYTAADNFLSYPGGALDAFGFDDGTRRLPEPVRRLAAGRKVDRVQFSPDQLEEMGRSFRNVWSPSSGGMRPHFGYSGVHADRATIFGREVGFLNSLTLSNGAASTERRENVYEGSAELVPRSQYHVRESTVEVMGGLTSSLNLKLSEDSRLKLNLLYTRHADDRVLVSEGPNTDLGTDNVRLTQLAYVQRGLFSAVLSGKQSLAVAGSELDWTASYSRASRDEPDRRQSVYEQEAASEKMLLSPRSLYPLTRIFGHSLEYDRAFKANWMVPIVAREPLDVRFKTGLYSRDRNRNSSFRRFGFTCRGGDCLDRAQAPEWLLSEAHLAAGNYRLEETTRANDSYDATDVIVATYGMADVELAQRLQLVGGVRLEQSNQNVEARSPFVNNAPGDTEVRLSNTDLLPAFNLTWKATPRMNVRLAYSTTLARPELRELSPFSMYNFETGYNETGNPSLQASHLRNYDLRWELYPGGQEMAAVGFFYKKMDRPIEKYLSADVGGYALAPLNGLDGELRGAEVELRTTLARAWEVAGRPLGARRAPAGLGAWGVSVNYTRVESEVRLESAGRVVTTPLNGQADRALNLGLFYGTKRVDGALLYRSFGRRLSSFGLGVLPDIYEYPLRSLDLTLGCNFGRGLRLKLSSENLLDEEVQYRQGSAPTRRWSPGRKVGLALQYKS